MISMTTKRYKVDSNNVYSVADEVGMSRDRLAQDYLTSDIQGSVLYVEVEEEDNGS